MSRVRVPRRLAAVATVLVVAGMMPAVFALRSKPPVDWRAALVSMQPRAEAGRLVQPLADGGRVELTLQPELQRAAERLLGEADPIQGAAVVVSVRDGKLLALAGRNRATPAANVPSLATTAWAPSASVFKLVTTAALLDAGLKPDTRVCYHGGVHSVEADNLEDHPAKDDRCRSLAYGLAKSQNAIIARLAHDYLDAATLDRMARAFGFGVAPAFELPAGASSLALPADGLGFARTAAGFWNSKLSPLQGALLAAMIARDGDAVAPRLVERVVDGDGRTVQSAAETPATHRALGAATAHTLGRMMIGTTEWGSANRAFRDPSTHRRRLAGVRVAGKTGTLTGRDPALAYSWFVGFAPADNPEVAFAVLLGRADESDVRAAEVVRALLASWLTLAPAAPLVASSK